MFDRVCERWLVSHLTSHSFIFITSRFTVQQAHSKRKKKKQDTKERERERAREGEGWTVLRHSRRLRAPLQARYGLLAPLDGCLGPLRRVPYGLHSRLRNLKPPLELSQLLLFGRLRTALALAVFTSTSTSRLRSRRGRYRPQIFEFRRLVLHVTFGTTERASNLSLRTFLCRQPESKRSFANLLERRFKSTSRRRRLSPRLRLDRARFG